MDKPSLIISNLFCIFYQITIFSLHIHILFFEKQVTTDMQIIFYLNIIITLIVVILVIIQNQSLKTDLFQFLYQFILVIITTETILRNKQSDLMYLQIVNVNNNLIMTLMYLEKRSQFLYYLLTISATSVYVTLRFSINLEYQGFEIIIILIQAGLSLIGPLIVLSLKSNKIQQNEAKTKNFTSEMMFSPLQEQSRFKIQQQSQNQSQELPGYPQKQSPKKNNIDMKTMEMKNLIQSQIQEVLSEGVAIIKLGDTNKENVQILHNNKSILELLNIQDGLEILEGVSRLTNTKITRVNSFKRSVENSLQLYESFNFQKMIKNNQTYQKKKFAYNIIDSFNQIANRSSRIFVESKEEKEQNGFNLIFTEIYKKLQSSTYQTFLKQKQTNLDLISVLNGYSFSQTLETQIQLEIKIYLTYYKGNPYSVLLVRDISHRDKIDILFEQDKAKSNQLNFVSHEFRTPLNCIITMLEMCEDVDSKKFIAQAQMKQSNFIEIAVQNCKYLLNLSNDLLDLAQLKVNKFKLKKSTFEIREVFEDCISMFRLMAEKRNLSLSFQIQDFLTIYQDKSRIKQIIVNLIGNAMKFTEKGSILLSAKRVEKNVLEIKVSDTGVGIKKEEEGNLFKAFGQIQNTIENKKLNRSGVGLGLIISNMIAQNLNSNQTGLMFDSIYGKGTQFYFFVEYQKLEEDNDSWGNSAQLLQINQLSKDIGYQNHSCDRNLNTPQTTDIDLPQRLLKSKRPYLFKQTVYSCNCSQLLIVDDSQFNLEAMRLLLLKRKIKQLDQTISGSLAIEKVKQKLLSDCCTSYQLIMLDLDMPLMNGIETFKIMNQIFMENGITTKVIACSAYDKNKTKSVVLFAGMADYVEKPVRKDELDRIIKNYVNLSV